MPTSSNVTRVVAALAFFLGLCAQAAPLVGRSLEVQSTHQSGGDEYVVILSKDPEGQTPADVHAADVLSRLDLSLNHPDVRLLFNNSAFHGFAASMKSHCLDALANMTDVTHVEKSVSITSFGASTRANSPWGLQRVSSSSNVSGNEKSMDFSYSYDDQKLGQGVDIYVVDTGMNVQHAAFTGRARMGWSFEADSGDHDGHGTHVAGTAAGSYFGIATASNLIGVKVLGDDGAGSSADTIAGMDYVVQQHDRRRGEEGFVGSVMSMSWGLTAISDAVTTAIQSATDSGVHVSVAAGNSATDACQASPSNTGGKNSDSVITVGSIGMNNGISSFSNTGECVDIYAPGEDVLSAWKDTSVTVNYLSGTSMACPHVTGVMAYLMAADSSLAGNPKALKAKLLGMALKGQVTGKTNAGKGLLLNNGVTDPTGTEGILKRTPGLMGLDRIIAALFGNDHAIVSHDATKLRF